MKEAYQNNNRLGAAKAIMHLGVSDIYRKKFVSAEHYLLQAIQMFENKGSDADIGWCNLWLGQTLYSQTRFTEAITRYRTSLPYLDKLRDAEGEGKAWAWMGFIYAAKGNYDSSFEYCSKSLLIRQKMGDGVCVAAALTNMGHLYRVAGAYNDALDYYRQGLQYAITNSIDIVGARWNYLDEPLAVIYKLMNRPDSSLYYLQKALRIDPENQMTHISLGEVLLTKKQYDSALAIFLNPVERFRRENNRWDLMRVLLDVAKAYEGKMNYTVALQYAKEALSIADAGDVKQYVVDAYALLSKIYDGLHNKNSAYLYLQRFTALKDSMMNNQLLWRLSNYKKQADFKKQLDHIALLDKDNKIKEEKLKRESLLKWILMVFLLIGGGSGVMLYKTLSLRRKNEQLEGKHKQSQLQQHVTELEDAGTSCTNEPSFHF
ncbi:MAG: tetratricopeptide repeat protein [Chitinophagaceae bacterium]